MYVLKNLIILALASSAFACRCTQGGTAGGRLDIPATQTSCIEAGGTVQNGGGASINCAGSNHARFDDRCRANTGQFGTGIPNLRSTCGRA
ncbi:hypothetical protein EDB81DRAFT_880243 [Dactylonectria macrodidyma]|uniref:Uncharacterized protein n=1 Tax=Dactylonectria macrodidyma TaxID=307937 RepID=A0A9P9F8H3_9HYPO|nr:hypothetical protein EDB81DRAFT_880243 [Dactylonectria macrodidyma]